MPPGAGAESIVREPGHAVPAARDALRRVWGLQPWGWGGGDAGGWQPSPGGAGEGCRPAGVKAGPSRSLHRLFQGPGVGQALEEGRPSPGPPAPSQVGQSPPGSIDKCPKPLPLSPRPRLGSHPLRLPWLAAGDRPQPTGWALETGGAGRQQGALCPLPPPTLWYPGFLFSMTITSLARVGGSFRSPPASSVIPRLC